MIGAALVLIALILAVPAIRRYRKAQRRDAHLHAWWIDANRPHLYDWATDPWYADELEGDL